VPAKDWRRGSGNFSAVIDGDWLLTLIYIGVWANFDTIRPLAAPNLSHIDGDGLSGTGTASPDQMM